MCESPEVYDERTVQARKAHICCECGLGIHPGERYERVRGKWSGEWLTFRTCLPCRDLRNLLLSTVPQYCCELAFGDLREACAEERIPFPSPAMASPAGSS